MTERVYQEGGTLSHVAESSESLARCGKDPWPARWRGASNGVNDKVIAYQLTLCLGCVDAIRNGKRKS